MAAGRYAALLEPSKPPASQATPQPGQEKQESSLASQADKTKTIPSIKQSTVQSTRQPTRQFTKQSTKQSIEPNDKDIVSKPKGFYITYRLDKRLNDAVDYLQEKHGIKKVDRSLILNAMLDTDEKWTDEALDKLVDPLLSILTSRLLS